MRTDSVPFSSIPLFRGPFLLLGPLTRTRIKVQLILKRRLIRTRTPANVVPNLVLGRGKKPKTNQRRDSIATHRRHRFFFCCLFPVPRFSLPIAFLVPLRVEPNYKADTRFVHGFLLASYEKVAVNRD